MTAQHTNKARRDQLLKATSRSFYLTLRVLPGRIRPQISLAYLIARMADTIADTGVLPVEQRLSSLQQLRDQILSPGSVSPGFGELAGRQGTFAEKELLQSAGETLAAIRDFAPEDQRLLREVLTTITRGQELDLLRFGKPEESGGGLAGAKIVALETAGELDDYTYLVAGCVGEFWTKMCRAHLFPRARLDWGQMVGDGTRLGKGLQLVNILRDLPEDLRRGRCYLPRQEMERARLMPETLFSLAKEANFTGLFHEYLEKAERHLEAGWNYANALPYAQYRVRLACAWPILMGVRTIAKLKAATVTELRERIKISRNEVRGIMLRTVLASPVPAWWRNLLKGAANPVASGGKKA